MKEKGRNNNWGTLHLLAAFFVMYGHQCALLNQSAPTILGTRIQAWGVKIIFLISGYLITKSLLAEKGSRIKKSLIYAIKRFGRIYPELIVCVVISSVVLGAIFSQLSVTDYFASQGWWGYIWANIRLKPVYGLPGVFLNNPYVGAINGSLWTLPVEVFVYLVFWIIWVLIDNRKVSRAVYYLVTSILLGLFLMRFCLYPDASLVFYGTDWLQALDIIPYMIVGGLFNLIDLKKYLNVQVALALLLFFNGITIRTKALSELVCLVITTYIVFSIGFAEEQKLKLKVFKGEYAYGIYLWGFVVQQSMIQLFYVEYQVFTSVNTLLIASLAVTYLLALVSYEVIYTPISKWNKKLVQFVRKNRD